MVVIWVAVETIQFSGFPSFWGLLVLLENVSWLRDSASNWSTKLKYFILLIKVSSSFTSVSLWIKRDTYFVTNRPCNLIYASLLVFSSSKLLITSSPLDFLRPKVRIIGVFQTMADDLINIVLAKWMYYNTNNYYSFAFEAVLEAEAFTKV